MAINTTELLQAIPGGEPSGADVSFSNEFDLIREARRADDATLSQGDWQTTLKVADWREVIKLASKVLREQSKDLQVGVWLGEALIARHGFDGAADAFTLLDGLIETWWEGFYPRAEGDDLDERASKLAWFNTWGAAALKKAPLAAGDPGVNLIDWQTSREIDNLARQNASAHREALEQGKLNGEAFDKAMHNSGADFISGLLASIEAAQTAFDALQQHMDARFGKQAPSLMELADTLKRAKQVVGRAAQALGLLNTDSANDIDPTDANTGATNPSARAGTFALPALTQAGNGATRAELLRVLHEIAEHFRRTEPHSPVPFLLERAVSWADTPLDQWLEDVVNDDSVLRMIRDRIGVSRRTS
ncbi:MAG: type VI secretion system protein TssA [Pseudomonadales bacterium]|jgi:type VI secretion system protein ImpA|nr:type VI secretion system protein TssA [Pseudomonadales bacterium]